MLASSVCGRSARTASAVCRNERTGWFAALLVAGRKSVRGENKKNCALLHIGIRPLWTQHRRAHEIQRTIESIATYSTRGLSSGLAWAEGPSEVCSCTFGDLKFAYTLLLEIHDMFTYQSSYLATDIS